MKQQKVVAGPVRGQLRVEYVDRGKSRTELKNPLPGYVGQWLASSGGFPYKRGER